VNEKKGAWRRSSIGRANPARAIHASTPWRPGQAVRARARASLSFFRTGPEAQASLGVAVPISRTLSLTPSAQIGVGAFVTTRGCCETEALVGPPSPFSSAYPRTNDPFAFAAMTVGLGFDPGISTHVSTEE
jgi:hypothetical protein